MDYAEIQKKLRYFWLGYGLLMTGLSLVGAFMLGNLALLVVFALGALLFWAARESGRKQAADVVLQLFFLLVILECIAALAMDYISALLLGFMLAASGYSLFVWRKEAPKTTPED